MAKVTFFETDLKKVDGLFSLFVPPLAFTPTQSVFWSFTCAKPFIFIQTKRKKNKQKTHQQFFAAALGCIKAWMEPFILDSGDFHCGGKVHCENRSLSVWRPSAPYNFQVSVHNNSFPFFFFKVHLKCLRKWLLSGKYHRVPKYVWCWINCAVVSRAV